MAIKMATVWFTDFCSNDCFYCKHSRDNWDLKRKRMTKDEILDAFKRAYKGGLDHFLLVGGMDLFFDDEKIVDITSAIKEQFPKCKLYLSIGEKYAEIYKKYQDAGADGFILYHRSANSDHFEYLHSMKMAGDFRKECLFALKELGFEVGTGITVGWPYQTPKALAEDLTFLKDLKPDLIHVERFVPQEGSKMEKEPEGDPEAYEEVVKKLKEMFPESHVLTEKDFIEMK